MKEIKNILGSISKTPEFNKKMNSGRMIDEIIDALPPVLKKGVDFAYVKNDIFYFVVSHPVYKSEFTFRMSHIKHIVDISGIKVQKIECFITNKPKISNTEIEEELKSFYEESSHGIFENHVTDEVLRAKFEKIRKIIINNNKQNPQD